MTKTQFEDIKSRLAKWRSERGLSVESQQANFKVNYTKELIEFFEAERDCNEFEMIDALCDMIVVAINAGHILCMEFGDYETNDVTTFNLTYPLLDNDCVYRLCYELRYIGYDPYKCLLETVNELETRTGSWNEQEGKWCKDLGAYTFWEATIKAEEYVCREIVNYKKHSYDSGDDEYWYFVCEWGDGYTSKIPIKKWYKADYSKCKLQ